MSGSLASMTVPPAGSSTTGLMGWPSVPTGIPGGVMALPVTPVAAETYIQNIAHSTDLVRLEMHQMARIY